MLTGVRDILKCRGIVVFTVEAMELGQGLGQGEELSQGLDQGEGQGLGPDQNLGQGEEFGKGQMEMDKFTSLSSSSTSSFALQPSGRIAHSQEYIERIIHEVGQD